MIIPFILGTGRGVRRRTLAAIAGLGLVATACGTTEAPGPLQPSGAQGRLRFVNLVTDTDTVRSRVNAILEGVPFGVNVSYAQSTPVTLPAPSTAFYAAVLAGSRSLVLKRAIDTTAIVATFNVTIDDGQDRTVYAIRGTGGAVTSFVTTDTNPAAAPTQTRVRVVNLSPTAGAVDVFITAPNADLAAATPTVANLAYQGVSAYLALAPATYRFRAVPAGTAPASRSANVIINVSSLALAGGTGRTIVTADHAVGGAPLRAFVLSDR